MTWIQQTTTTIILEGNTIYLKYHLPIIVMVAKTTVQIIHINLSIINLKFQLSQKKKQITRINKSNEVILEMQHQKIHLRTIVINRIKDPIQETTTTLIIRKLRFLIRNLIPFPQSRRILLSNYLQECLLKMDSLLAQGDMDIETL